MGEVLLPFLLSISQQHTALLQDKKSRVSRKRSQAAVTWATQQSMLTLTVNPFG